MKISLLAPPAAPHPLGAPASSPVLAGGASPFVVAEARFASQSQPGTVWLAQAFADGRSVCNCLGFTTAGHCWHVAALARPNRRKKQ